jgi:hypothetical protein
MPIEQRQAQTFPCATSWSHRLILNLPLPNLVTASALRNQCRGDFFSGARQRPETIARSRLIRYDICVGVFVSLCTLAMIHARIGSKSTLIAPAVLDCTNSRKGVRRNVGGISPIARVSANSASRSSPDALPSGVSKDFERFLCRCYINPSGT